MAEEKYTTSKSKRLRFTRSLSFRILVSVMIILLLIIGIFGAYLSTISRNNSKKFIVEDILIPKFESLAKEKDNDFETIKKLTEFTAQKIEDKIQDSKKRTSDEVDELFEGYLSKKPDGSYRSSLNDSKGRYQMAAFINNKSELNVRLKGIFVDAFLYFDPFAESLLPFVFTTYFASNNSIWQYGFPDWALTSLADEYFDKYGWFYDADPVHNPDKGHAWTDMYYDGLQEQWMISSLMPIYDGDEFLGIVGQDLILEKIIEITKRSTIGETGVLFFVDNLGNIIAHPDTEYLISENAKNDEKLNLKTLSDKPLTKALQTFKTDEQGYMFSEESNRRIVMWFPLKSINWKMVYVVSEDELLIIADQTNIQFILTFIFFSLLILIFIILLVKIRVTDPIKKLTEITETIGRGNLGVTIDITTKDEIGQLAASFEKMKQSLKTTNKELVENQKNLEVKVEERTRELNEKIIELNQNETAILNIMDDLQKTLEELQQSQFIIKDQNVQLQKLNKIKSNFLNITSHELRTPMSAVKGYIQMMLKGNLGTINDEQKKALDIILRNTNRLERLIQDILDISRLESGTMKFIIKKTDVIKMVNEVAETMQVSADGKGIKINTETGIDVPELTIDKDRITQVVVNLVNNAIKFSPNDSKIHIKTRKEKEDVLFEVQDYGRGIPKEHHKKIFQSFYQVDSDADTKFGGAGLGLAICYGIVFAHGGRIWVESTGKPGEGSTFRFTLPVESVINIEERFKGADVFGLEKE